MITQFKNAAYLVSVGAILVMLSSSLNADLSSLAKNDPYPTFTALDPLIDRLLLSPFAVRFRHEHQYRSRKGNFMFSVSPFGQNAVVGKNVKSEKIYRRVPIELGDLTGRWGLVPLLFGDTPACFPDIEIYSPTLGEALGKLMQAGEIALNTNNEDPAAVDPNQRCGYLSFPLKYRKRGLRASCSIDLCAGFGLNIEGGVASITQYTRDLPDPFCGRGVCDPMGTGSPVLDYQWIDLTQYDAGPNELPEFSTVGGRDPCFDIIGITSTILVDFFSRPFACIAKEIGLNIDSYCGISSEELRFNLYWTHPYEYYRDSYEWAHVAIIPYFMGSVSISPGKIKNEHKAFEPYFANNGHTAIGGSAGLYLDFADTLQVGAECSYTHFFGRHYTDLRVPNSKYQTTVFPYFTNAHIKPGGNIFFALRVLAYHFCDALSIYVQYNMVDHKADTICLNHPDPAYYPNQLERVSAWTNKSFNAAAVYDILPNFGVGFLWQAPVRQRNSYKSTTLMFTAYAFF